MAGGDCSEAGRGKPADTDRKPERDPGCRAGPRGQVVLPKLDEHREGDLDRDPGGGSGDKADDRVRAYPQPDQSRYRGGIAREDGAGECGYSNVSAYI